MPQAMYIQSLQPISIQSSSILNVVANREGLLRLRVLDTQGKVAKSIETVVNEGSQQLSLNLGDLNSGIYVLNAFSGEVFLKSIKFTKQ